MDDLVEKLISMKNNVVKEFEKKHSLLGKLRGKFVDGKRFGMRLLDEDGSVLGEYTLSGKGNYIDTHYEKGISDDVWATAEMKSSLLEESLKFEPGFYTEPIKTTGKMMKFYLKAMKKGDAKISWS